MARIILTEEQLRIVREANGPVDVVDAQGQPVASMRVLDAMELEAIEHYRRRKASGIQEPGIPGARVQAFLRKLQEIADREGIDEAKVKELLRRERAGEPL
jgi:hypothetical protein